MNLRDTASRAERRRAAELKLGEPHGRALLDAVSDLVFVIGIDGVYRAVKADRPDDLAAPPDRLVGTAITDVLPLDVAERIMSCALDALERNSVEAVDYTLLIDGQQRSFEGRVAASGPDEFILIVRDATQRIRQTAELQRLAGELEQRLVELERERDFTRTVVQSVPTFLALADEQGGLLGLNESLEAATGLKSAEETGRAFWEALVPDEQRAVAERMFRALLHGKTDADRELQLLARDGERRTVDWSGTPVVDQFGLTRVILCGVDVTERLRQQEELRRSRARIVEAGDAERRRLQRNLHDGAQQQLVFVSQAMRLARNVVSRDASRAAELLDRSIDAMATAHADLRELARGLHPALLTERGLAPAVQALAARAPLPVAVEAEEGDRFATPLETAAYYVVAEALTNVAKYAQATSAVVRIARGGDVAVIEVEDDGHGGADPAAGSGLRGLHDRVEALGGTFSVESARGAGTVLRAELPLM